MNPVNGVTTNNGVTTLNPADMSQQDFISAVYLERGEMLDSEVRRIIDEIDKSNQYVDTINTLLGKVNVAEYGTSEYTAPTWSKNGGSIILDNGYGLNFQPDGNGGSTFTLLDAEGNQLIYQNQTLIPVPSGTTVDALEVGIPVMSDMTFVLDDGTEITFQTGTPDTAFSSTDFSGGLTDITTVTITHGNQGVTITDVNTASPVLGTPNLTGRTLDANSNDGYVLLESGGVHSWEYDGLGTGSIVRTNPNDANDQLTGYFARKLAFEADITDEYSSTDALVSAYGNGLIDSDIVQNGGVVNANNWTTTGSVTTSGDLTFGGGTGDSNGVAEQTVTLNEELTYTLSLDYKRIGVELRESALIEVIDVVTGNVLFTDTFSTTSANSQTFSGTFTAPSSGNAILRITDTSAGPEERPSTDLSIDNISLIPQTLNNPVNRPVLTKKERDLLTEILRIPYSDASGVGNLTPEEWVELKQSLINARDNLNGSSQLQTVQLQRAMQTYNQNYEAMSNAQQKIYSLLRDIISNVK